MNFRRLRAIARKEVLHIIRDPRSLAAAIAAAAHHAADVRLRAEPGRRSHPDLSSTIMDQSPQSRDLIQRISRLALFPRSSSRCTATVPSSKPWTSARCSDRRRDPATIIREESARRQEPAQVQLLIDGSDSNTAAIAQGYAEGLVADLFAQRRNDAQSQRAGA